MKLSRIVCGALFSIFLSAVVQAADYAVYLEDAKWQLHRKPLYNMEFTVDPDQGFLGLQWPSTPVKYLVTFTGGCLYTYPSPWDSKSIWIDLGYKGDDGLWHLTKPINNSTPNPQGPTQAELTGVGSYSSKTAFKFEMSIPYAPEGVVISSIPVAQSPEIPAVMPTKASFKVDLVYFNGTKLPDPACPLVEVYYTAASPSCKGTRVIIEYLPKGADPAKPWVPVTPDMAPNPLMTQNTFYKKGVVAFNLNWAFQDSNHFRIKFMESVHGLTGYYWKDIAVEEFDVAPPVVLMPPPDPAPLAPPPNVIDPQKMMEMMQQLGTYPK